MPLASTMIRRLNKFKFKLLTNASNSPDKRPVIKNGLSINNYCDIPTKSSLIPPSLRLILGGGPSNLHQYCDKLHKELGPIFREHLGSTELIFIADTELIRTIVANEGSHPRHNVPESWTFYNEIHNIQRGLFFQTGDSWMRLRKAFNKVMLANPKVMTKFHHDLIKINADLMENWISRNETKSDIGTIEINDLKKELCRWSIESTGFMLFGLRMGCVQLCTSHDPRADELVDNVATMFAETSRFQLLPVSLAYRWNLGTWRRFDKATTNMLRIATDYTNENISKVKDKKLTHNLVTDLMGLGSLSVEEISRSVVDLIVAAADTTSNSMQWMLYLLSKHEDVQSKILAEVEPLFASGSCDPSEFMDSIPYLKAFVREVFRLYPTAPFLARTLDKDVILNGFHIPAGKPIVFSLFTTSRMGDFFEDPMEFRPERWLRDSNAKDFHCPKRTASAFASLPFGIGARMCIGRRAADIEICLFIATFVRQFKSRAQVDELKIKLKMILGPNKPIKLSLQSRRSPRNNNCKGIDTNECRVHNSSTQLSIVLHELENRCGTCGRD